MTRDGAVAILDVGGVHPQPDQVPVGVGDDVALAAFDLLAGVVAPGAAAFRGFHRLAVDHAGRRAGLPTRPLARGDTSAWLIRASVPSLRPAVEISLHRRDRAENPSAAPATGSRSTPGTRWHPPPRASSVSRGRPSRIRFGHEGLDQRPLRIRHVACIAQTWPPILRAGDLSPGHRVLHELLHSDGIPTH